MATPRLPLGKKGPRKANPQYKRRLGQPWTGKDVMRLTGNLKAERDRAKAALDRARAQCGTVASIVMLSLTYVSAGTGTVGRCSRSCGRRPSRRRDFQPNSRL